jgi:glutamate-ammonia-ligase adenylyltransferase
VLAFSDFVQESVPLTRTGWRSLRTPPQADEWRHYAGWLQTALEDVADEATLMRELRQFRRRVMVRIAWAQALELVRREHAAAAKRAGADADCRRARLALRRLL